MTDLILYRGDTKTITVTLKDNEGDPVDITGDTIYFTIKTSIDDVVDDSTALVKKDITTHSDPTNGVSVIQLSPTDTNIKPGNYFFDIQIKRVSGQVITLINDKIRVLGDVTRRV